MLFLDQCLDDLWCFKVVPFSFQQCTSTKSPTLILSILSKQKPVSLKTITDQILEKEIENRCQISKLLAKTKKNLDRKYLKKENEIRHLYQYQLSLLEKQKQEEFQDILSYNRSYLSYISTSENRYVPSNSTN